MKRDGKVCIGKIFPDSVMKIMTYKFNGIKNYVETKLL